MRLRSIRSGKGDVRQVKYADRVVAARQKYLDIGSQFGAQRMADLVSIALNDPSVMGKNALGAERLGRVFQRVDEITTPLPEAPKEG